MRACVDSLATLLLAIWIPSLAVATDGAFTLTARLLVVSWMRHRTDQDVERFEDRENDSQPQSENAIARNG